MNLSDFEKGYDAGFEAAQKKVAEMVRAEVDRLVFIELNRYREAGKTIGMKLGRLAERKRVCQVLKDHPEMVERVLWRASEYVAD